MSGDQFLDRETLIAIYFIQKILFILGDEVLVTGWGRITNNKKEGQDNFRRDRAGSDILKKVKVPIFKDSTCKSYNLDLDKQLCAGGRKGVYRFRMIMSCLRDCSNQFQNYESWIIFHKIYCLSIYIFSKRKKQHVDIFRSLTFNKFHDFFSGIG